MSAAPIRFGTSGWRGVIADDFTFAGVRLAAAAIARHLRARHRQAKVLVAYDTRFFSEEFGRAAARVLSCEGVGVLLAERATPTPAVSFEIRGRGLQGGVNFTASHNPAEYNGLKFSGADGAPADREQSAEIERIAAELAARGWEPRAGDDARPAETVDPRPTYLEGLDHLVRFDLIRKGKMALAYDAMHGAGAGWLDRALVERGIPVRVLHAERNVLFGGHAPDPSPDHLGSLVPALREGSAGLGLATDGDADRFGILDAGGRFLSPNHFLGLAYDYLVRSRGWRLGVVRSVATSHLVDAVARHHRLPVYQTPVGFKYIGPYVLEDRVALGGEESAGLSIRGHIPEKDGILACLLAAEMAAEGGPLGAQLRELFRRIGAEFWPVRLNVPLTAAASERLAGWMKSDPEEFLGRRVRRTDRTDGLQLEFEDGSWLLVRPSGTEPLSRIYAEAGSPRLASRLAEETKQWILS
ncbi:MAG TPA: phosphoglucomutase/phosphomannomutase family protein [Candidatus Acidoferrales bacterium]|nr:phosphoglucomutase/phosphomannomutase family protein [Candidatus Acidoferrales bacterium]